jgi:hypothetical protein
VVGADDAAVPTRFSTTTARPSDWLSTGAARRVVVSTKPPGGKVATLHGP